MMDAATKKQIVKNAQELWDAGNGLEAGKLIFETIPREKRGKWAVNVLKLAYKHFPLADEIDAVIEFAENTEQWGIDLKKQGRAAHEIVDKVNRHPYQTPFPFPKLIYALATNVGKVTYNAYLYGAPFDHSAGWEIANILHQIVLALNNHEFSEKAWGTLCNETFIMLDSPIMCHPYCPICYANGLIFDKHSIPTS